MSLPTLLLVRLELLARNLGLAGRVFLGGLFVEVCVAQLNHRGDEFPTVELGFIHEVFVEGLFMFMAVFGLLHLLDKTVLTKDGEERRSQHLVNAIPVLGLDDDHVGNQFARLFWTVLSEL